MEWVFSMISGSDQTLLYNSSDSKSYQKKIGIYNAVALISLAGSSFLGGVFSDFSWKLVFILGVITQIFSISIVKLVKTKRKEHLAENKTIVDFLKALKGLFSNKRLKFLVCAIACFGIRNISYIWRVI